MSYVSREFDDQVAALLVSGGVGLLPTDTIYGLSAVAAKPAAVQKLYELKGRDENKPMIILISDLEQLAPLGVNPYDLKPVLKYWPGAITFIAPAPEAPAWLNKAGDSLAIRMPDYPQLLKLLTITGPIISTSANLSGQPPIRNLSQAQKIFADKLDFYIDKPPLGKAASTIAKVKAGKVEIIRQGEVKIKLEEVSDEAG